MVPTAPPHVRRNAPGNKAPRQSSLPRNNKNDSGTAMRKGLVNLLILLAMLIAGAGLPPVSHSHAHSISPKLLADLKIGQAGMASADDAAKDRPADTAGHVAPHHHCIGDVSPATPCIAKVENKVRSLLRPATAAPLASLAHAPLTEPPSA